MNFPTDTAAEAQPDLQFRLPRVDPHFADQVLLEIDALLDAEEEQACADIDCDGDHADALPGHIESMTLMIPLLESMLGDAPNSASPALVARVVMMATWPALPEQMIMQIGFGRRVAEKNVLSMMRLIARSTQRGLTVDEYVAEHDAKLDEPLTRLFLGESRRAPEADRISRGIDLIRWMLAVTPEPLRAELLCVLGWLYWARGKRPLAFLHLDAAWQIRPGHVLAYGLEQHFINRGTPEWLRAKPMPATALPR